MERPQPRAVIQKAKEFFKRPHTQDSQTREGSLALAQKAKLETQAKVIQSKENTHANEVSGDTAKSLVGSVLVGHPSTHGITRGAFKEVTKDLKKPPQPLK